MIFVMEYEAPATPVAVEKPAAKEPVINKRDWEEAYRRRSLENRNKHGRTSGYANTSSYVETVARVNDPDSFGPMSYTNSDANLALKRHGLVLRYRRQAIEQTPPEQRGVVCKPFSDEWEQRILQLCYEFMLSSEGAQYLAKSSQQGTEVEQAFNDMLRILRDTYSIIRRNDITMDMKAFKK